MVKFLINGTAIGAEINFFLYRRVATESGDGRLAFIWQTKAAASLMIAADFATFFIPRRALLILIGAWEDGDGSDWRFSVNG